MTILYVVFAESTSQVPETDKIHSTPNNDVDPLTNENLLMTMEGCNRFELPTHSEANNDGIFLLKL